MRICGKKILNKEAKIVKVHGIQMAESAFKEEPGSQNSKKKSFLLKMLHI